MEQNNFLFLDKIGLKSNGWITEVSKDALKDFSKKTNETHCKNENENEN